MRAIEPAFVFGQKERAAALSSKLSPEGHKFRRHLENTARQILCLASFEGGKGRTMGGDFSLEMLRGDERMARPKRKWVAALSSERPPRMSSSGDRYSVAWARLCVLSHWGEFVVNQ